MTETFDDLLPLSAIRTAPGEYDIVAESGRRLWFMEGTALAEWIVSRINGQWREIETAPTDGTNFLACSSASSVFLAHYANGIVDSSDWTDEDGYHHRHATHWMPLPEPPQVAKSDSCVLCKQSREAHKKPNCECAGIFALGKKHPATKDY